MIVAYSVHYTPVQGMATIVIAVTVHTFSGFLSFHLLQIYIIYEQSLNIDKAIVS
jgi:hypothetical protein